MSIWVKITYNCRPIEQSHFFISAINPFKDSQCSKQALGEVLGELMIPLQGDSRLWSWADRTNWTRRFNRGAKLPCVAHWPFKPVHWEGALPQRDKNLGRKGDFAQPSSSDSPVVTANHKHNLTQQLTKPRPGEIKISLWFNMSLLPCRPAVSWRLAVVEPSPGPGVKPCTVGASSLWQGWGSAEAPPWTDLPGRWLWPWVHPRVRVPENSPFSLVGSSGSQYPGLTQI